jgi:hypothetical protein
LLKVRIESHYFFVEIHYAALAKKPDIKLVVPEAAVADNVPLP